jgi:thioesterase domain-containing protein
MITFAWHGYEGVDPAHEFGPLKAEFEKGGVPCMIVRSPRAKTKTPNQDRAKIMVEALRGVEGDVALVGISNQGPLVVAGRPIKRIVFIDAAIPRPSKSFWETSKEQRGLASFPTRILASLSPGMHEVCRLAELPKAEYLHIG